MTPLITTFILAQLASAVAPPVVAPPAAPSSASVEAQARRVLRTIRVLRALPQPWTDERIEAASTASASVGR